MTDVFWTDDKISQLHEQVATAKPYSAIAREVGCCSKNAAVGKAHRLGILHPNSPLVNRKTETLPIRLGRLNRFPESGLCVFPLGHPGEDGFHFCGERVAEYGRRYCDKHHRAAYIPGSALTDAVKQINYPASNIALIPGFR